MNILTIGNSFSQDATRYLHQVSGETLYVRNLYIGGCSLETHVNNIKAEAVAYEYQKNGRLMRMISINEAIKKKKWDIVTIQQVSHFSGIYETYEPHLGFLVSYIKEMCPNAKIMFHRTWAYSTKSEHGGFVSYERNQEKMYNAIIEASTRALAPYGIEVIPNGEAVQMARALPEFNEDVRDITRDGFHMSLDYGRYLTALVMYKYFTGNDTTLVEYEPCKTDKAINARLKEIANTVKPEVKQGFVANAQNIKILKGGKCFIFVQEHENQGVGFL